MVVVVVSGSSSSSIVVVVVVVVVVKSVLECSSILNVIISLFTIHSLIL